MNLPLSFKQGQDLHKIITTQTNLLLRTIKKLNTIKEQLDY